MAKTNEFDARVEPEQESSATGATIAAPSEADAVETVTASTTPAKTASAEASSAERTQLRPKRPPNRTRPASMEPT